MQHLEGSGTPVLYIGRKVLKVEMNSLYFLAYSLRTFTIPKHYFSEQQYLRHEFIIIT